MKIQLRSDQLVSMVFEKVINEPITFRSWNKGCFRIINPANNELKDRIEER